jgi:hypothetical protein
MQLWKLTARPLWSRCGRYRDLTVRAMRFARAYWVRNPLCDVGVHAVRACNGRALERSHANVRFAHQ